MADFADYWNDPNTQQLLGMASGLLSAGGPSSTPVSLGQAMSQGLLQSSKFGTVARENKIRDEQLSHMKTSDQLSQMQLIAAIRNQAVQEQMLRQLGFMPPGGPQGAPGMGGLSPLDPSGPNPSVMAGSGGGGYQPPTGAPTAPAMGGPGNIPEGLKTPLAMDLAFNGGKGAGGMMATYAKPISGRAGAPLWGFNPQTGKMEIQGFSPKVDEGMTVGPNGQISVAPGYAAAKQEVNSIPNPSGAMQTVDVTNNRKVQLSQPEFLTYTQSGGTVLPARYTRLAAELPGVRFGDASSLGTPKPSTPQVSQENFPRETPKDSKEAAQRQLTVLHAEAEQQRKEAGVVSPDLQREIDRAQSRVGGKTETAVLGATQSQSEAIQQVADTETAKVTAEGLAKRKLEQPKDTTLLEDAVSKTDQAIDAAKATLKHPGLYAATGSTGALVGKLPGTKAFDATQSLETLKGQIMLSVLQSMRSVSANGSSGMGALSNAEGEVLRNSIVNLQQAQTPEAVKAALTNVVSTLEGSKDRMTRGYTRLYGEAPELKSYHTNPNVRQPAAPGAPGVIPASGKWSIRPVNG